MTIWTFDTEFDEDGKTIELISIGLVSVEGHEYYAVSREFDPLRCNEWVRVNVLTKLPPVGDPSWKSRAQIRDEIVAIIAQGNSAPEFWAYFADYDWVVLCQLFGKMIDLPAGWPMYCRDLKQRMNDLGVKRAVLPAQPEGSVHNALDDARWVRDALLHLDKLFGS